MKLCIDFVIHIKISVSNITGKIKYPAEDSTFWILVFITFVLKQKMKRVKIKLMENENFSK